MFVSFTFCTNKDQHRCIPMKVELARDSKSTVWIIDIAPKFRATVSALWRMPFSPRELATDRFNAMQFV